MAQATLDGPNEHPIAKADAIAQIESDPATWIHDESDSRPCPHCDERIQLAEGDYVVVTLVEDDGRGRSTSLVWLCSEACYGEWTRDAHESGW